MQNERELRLGDYQDERVQNLDALGGVAEKERYGKTNHWIEVRMASLDALLTAVTLFSARSMVVNHRPIMVGEKRSREP